MPSSADQPASRRCAVIYNPVKISDTFRGTVEEALDDSRWRDTLWLATTEQDPGRGMVAQAVAEQVDLVIGAGGDGTVRIIADGLAGTGIPLGVVPEGTANLLARNLDVPLVERRAVAVAVAGRTRQIDLVKVQVDDAEPEHFAVMAGAGVDAMIMDETDPRLKEQIGSAAYFVAAGKALGRLPMRATVQVDDQPAMRRKAMLIVVGNVGQLQAGITLIPQALPDDGVLDVFIASPTRLRDWLVVLARLVTRRRKPDKPVEIITGRRVRVSVRERDDYQLDGDVNGTFVTMVMEVVPRALTVCVPDEA